MKRPPMPPRKSRLKQGKPLERGTPLKSGGNLDRSTPLKAQSKKRQRENRERRAMKDALFPDGTPPCVVPWCGKPADDLHEPLTRARRGSITDPDNAVPTCRGHNDELTLEPEWGYDLHLLVHSWDRRSLAEIAEDRREALAAWTPGQSWEVAS